MVNQNTALRRAGHRDQELETVFRPTFRTSEHDHGARVYTGRVSILYLVHSSTRRLPLCEAFMAPAVREWARPITHYDGSQKQCLFKGSRGGARRPNGLSVNRHTGSHLVEH